MSQRGCSLFCFLLRAEICFGVESLPIINMFIIFFMAAMMMTMMIMITDDDEKIPILYL